MARTLEAIVLVGGRGVRLAPLTLSLPKPLLPTAGVPFLAHLLARLQAAGVGHVVLASCYRADMFVEFFGHGSETGLDIECVTEPKPMGTGGAIRYAARRLRGTGNEPVLVANGDILSGHDIGAQLELHRTSGAAATLHLTRVDDPRAFGCVPTDTAGQVTAFAEKSAKPVTNQINAGCYVLNRAALDRIPMNRAVSVERETFPGLLADGATMMGYLDSTYWRDVGTPGSFVEASRHLVSGRLASTALPGPAGQFLRLHGSSIPPSALIERGSAVGARVRVGDGALVSGSVIFDDAEIDDHAVVHDSVVARGARIGSAATLRDAVVGESATVGAWCELRTGVRVWPHIEVPANRVYTADIVEPGELIR